jgi:hypothetical protein
MRTLLLTLCLATTLFAKPLSLRDRVAQAKAGDYIVTVQENNFSILVLRSVSPTEASFEEITVPENHFANALPNWKTWVASRAPGNTSWIRYEIDLTQTKLKKAISLPTRYALIASEETLLLPKLLALPLNSTPTAERRRIGPKPAAGESDRRALWLPAITVDTKQQPSPQVEALRTTWPKDDSKLAGIPIELYFDAARPTFPFPYWIELKSPHYNFKVRTIDSGSGMISPHP